MPELDRNVASGRRAGAAVRFFERMARQRQCDRHRRLDARAQSLCGRRRRWPAAQCGRRLHVSRRWRRWSGSGIVDPAAITQHWWLRRLAGAILLEPLHADAGLADELLARADRRVGGGRRHAWRLGDRETDWIAIRLGSDGVCPRFSALRSACSSWSLISWLFFRVPRRVATRLFKRLQLVSACFMAFSHGANDAQKAMGIITLALRHGRPACRRPRCRRG